MDLQKELGKAVPCIRNKGGFTLSIDEGICEIDTGYCVAVSKANEEATPAIIRWKESAIIEKICRYIETHKHDLNKSNRYLGAWVNPDNGVLYLDVSQIIVSFPLASNLAKMRDQIAIFSNKTKEVIKVN